MSRRCSLALSTRRRANSRPFAMGPHHSTAVRTQKSRAEARFWLTPTRSACKPRRNSETGTGVLPMQSATNRATIPHFKDQLLRAGLHGCQFSLSLQVRICPVQQPRIFLIDRVEVIVKALESFHRRELLAQQSGVARLRADPADHLPELGLRVLAVRNNENRAVGKCHPT